MLDGERTQPWELIVGAGRESSVQSPANALLEEAVSFWRLIINSAHFCYYHFTSATPLLSLFLSSYEAAIT